MIPFFESIADVWLPALWRASIHGGIAILIVWAIVIAARRIATVPAWAEHWMWRLVYLKMLIVLLAAKPLLLPVLPPPQAAPMAQSWSVPAPPTIADTSANADASVSSTNVDAVAASSTTSNLSSAKTAPVEPASPNAYLVLAIAWLIGATCQLVQLSRQFIGALRLPMRPLEKGWLIIECERMARDYGLKRVPKLAVSDHVDGPLLVGLLRPTIVLSSNVLAGCDRQQLQSVLAHELSHVRRSDLRWNLLPAIARVVFFFHPLLWVVHHRWRVSSEIACDTMAINRSAGSAAQYADGLLQVAVLGSQRSRLTHALGSVSAFTSPRLLKQRIIAMNTESNGSHRRAAWFVGCIAIFGLAGVFPWKAVSWAAQANLPNAGRNLDFEQRSDSGAAMHWGGGGKNHQLNLDETEPHSGKRCASIHGTQKDGFGTYTQCIDATRYVGKRIVYRGFLKSDVDGTGAIWMRIDAGETVVEFDNMAKRRVTGKTDWTQYEIVLDVPREATKICFGFLMTGAGKIWGDDLSIEVLGGTGKKPKPTGIDVKRYQRPRKLVNGGFERVVKGNRRLPDSWGGGGVGFDLSRDAETKRSGTASGRIEKTGTGGAFASFTQMFPADEFRGKHVRFSGWIKSQDAESVGLWMRIDGPNKRPLGFDNMSDRRVQGTTDWTGHSIDLDVPRSATHIALGFLSSGDGIAWADDLKLEVVGPLKKASAAKPIEVKRDEWPVAALNLGFEEASQFDPKIPGDWGGGGRGYELVRDPETKHVGTASARITKTGQGPFGTFTQVISAEAYRGQTLRYTGWLKTDAAAAARLWMRIDGPDNKPLGFHNMRDQPVQGTSDWTQHTLELDVPPDAVKIAIGFLLVGDGTVWGDGLALGPVSD